MKAFSLIEIIVVIMLIGIIFSLVLSSYTNKKQDTKLLTIKDIPAYVSNFSLNKISTLYIYGVKCNSSVLVLDEKSYIELPTFGFHKDDIVLKKDRHGQVEEVDFKERRIVKKREKVCFELKFEKGKFFNKFILASKDRFYLFIPFFQEVLSFTSLKEAEKVYMLDSLYPSSLDEYYRE